MAKKPVAKNPVAKSPMAKCTVANFVWRNAREPQMLSAVPDKNKQTVAPPISGCFVVVAVQFVSILAQSTFPYYPNFACAEEFPPAAYKL